MYDQGAAKLAMSQYTGYVGLKCIAYKHEGTQSNTPTCLAVAN